MCNQNQTRSDLVNCQTRSSLPSHGMEPHEYIIITIVRNYTEKYHEFVAILGIIGTILSMLKQQKQIVTNGA